MTSGRWESCGELQRWLEFLSAEVDAGEALNAEPAAALIPLKVIGELRKRDPGFALVEDATDQWTPADTLLHRLSLGLMRSLVRCRWDSAEAATDAVSGLLADQVAGRPSSLVLAAHLLDPEMSMTSGRVAASCRILLREPLTQVAAVEHDFLSRGYWWRARHGGPGARNAQLLVSGYFQDLDAGRRPESIAEAWPRLCGRPATTLVPRERVTSRQRGVENGG